VLENDLVEAIIGLPTDMFYNTGISTYVWIVSNRKPAARKGKVQLIDASGYWQKMRKSLGSKRKELSPEHIEEITQIFGKFKKLTKEGVPISRIFKNEDFGYRTITVERPLRDAKGNPVPQAKGKAKASPRPTPTCAIPRTSLSARTWKPISNAKSCPRAGRVDRPRQNPGWLRNPVQPPLLRLQAAASPGRNRCGTQGLHRPHPDHDWRVDQVSLEITLYRDLLSDIKTRVRQAQHKAALSANAEMILMYWDIGRMIAARQEREGWGAGVIPRLAVDLKNELPQEKGFSERNIGRMVAFHRAYPILQQSAAKSRPQAVPLLQPVDSKDDTILPQPVAKLEIERQPAVPPQTPSQSPLSQVSGVDNPAGSELQRAIMQLSWAHNVILLEKTKISPPAFGMPTRSWSMAGAVTP